MGAVQPWSVFVLRTVAAGLFSVWVSGQVIQSRVRVVPTRIYLPALAFVALVVAQMSFSISAYRHDTLVELLNFGAFGLLAFVTLQSVRERQDAKLLGFSLSAFGLAVATFALLQSFTTNGKLFWTVQVPADAPFFGPYVNHNHYAGLMEMLIPFPLVFALQNRINTATRFFLGFCAVIMGVSVVESGSRGGIIALVCQIVLLAVIGRFTKLRRGAGVALVLVLAAMATLLAVVADSGVISRISTMREPGRADVAGWRMQLNRDSLEMLRAKPILGWGLGAFPNVYPQFRSFPDDVPIRDAHNDYLQLLVETGAVGGVLAVWFLVLVFREGWRNLRESQNVWARGTALASMISVSGILVHSASDFNLHIPANAALFFVMCSLMVAPIESHGARSEPRRRNDGSRVEPSESQGQAEEFPQRLRVVVRRL